jgi:hypothetical protein
MTRADPDVVSELEASVQRLARWLSRLLIAAVFFNAMRVNLVYMYQLSLLNAERQGRLVSDADVLALSVRESFVGLPMIGLAIGTLVIFFRWVRAMNRLLGERGVQLRFSPDSAVIWFFVPFMNLVRPYQVMSELWRGSGAAQATIRGRSGTQAFPLVALWWAVLLTEFVGRAALAEVLPTTETIDGATVNAVVGAAFEIVGIGTALLARAVIQKITTRTLLLSAPRSVRTTATDEA